MTDLFIAVLNRAAAASWVILAVMVLRLVFRRSPRWILRPLWCLAAFSLVNYLINVISTFSILPTAELVPADIVSDFTPKIDSGFSLIDRGVNGILSSAVTGSAEPTNPIETAFLVASVIWIVGFVAILIYGLIGYIRLHLTVRASIFTEGNVYQCDDIDTPFILGVFKPRIYVPSGMDEKTLGYVLLHERSHVKRKDYLFKPFAFLLLAFYWFHPLVWLGYILFCRDVETVCDSYAVDNMTPEGRRDYAETLALFSTRRGFFAVSSLAFGEIAVKNRVKKVLRYDIADFWESFAAVILLLAVGFFVVPTPFKNEDVYNSVRGEIHHTYTARLVDIPFVIPRSAIPEDLSTLKYIAGAYGENENENREYEFKKNEYIAYKGDNTTIYLNEIYARVQFGLDPEYYVFFVFELSSELAEDRGEFLAVDMSKDLLSFWGDGDARTYEPDLEDANTTYERALHLVALGPEDSFCLCIPLSKLLATEGDLGFTYELYLVSYDEK